MNIIGMLAAKHSDDVFVPECKNGASYTGNLKIMDAWAMKKSWSNPLTWGYEIKVSRNDFLRDEKWHLYLAYCNEFYFVCPNKLIMPDELPAEAGLMWASTNSKRLYTKKKAPRREVSIPESLYRYILMARTKIHAPSSGSSGTQSREEFLKDWLEKRDNGQELNYLVSARISKVVANTQELNNKLTRDIAKYERVKTILKSKGLDPDTTSWEIEREIDKVLGLLPPDFKRNVDQCINYLSDLKDTIEKVKP